MHTPFLFAFFLLLSSGLSAQVYKGTIGRYPIYLQVEFIDNDGSLSGAYFYESKAVDIPFEGTLHGKQLVFKAGSPFTSDEDMELFSLLKVGTQLRGTWRLHGKELSVSLKEIDPAKVKQPYAANPFLEKQHFAPFESIRASLASFVPMDSVTTLKNGIVLSWYTEKHWDSELFRVSKGLPEATMQWVNARLEAAQVAAFTSYGSCGDPAKGFEYFATVNDYFVNADFLSLELIHSYSCGGAHPDFGSQQINLDLKNHLELSTEDLIHFPGVVKQNELNFSEWSQYRTAFATRMNDYLKALYPEYMTTAPTEDYSDMTDCPYDDPANWEFSDVRITADGFKIGAYFARVMRTCDDPEWAYIPYDVIEPYINPTYREVLMALSK